MYPDSDSILPLFVVLFGARRVGRSLWAWENRRWRRYSAPSGLQLDIEWPDDEAFERDPNAFSSCTRCAR